MQRALIFTCLSAFAVTGLIAQSPAPAPAARPSGAPVAKFDRTKAPVSSQPRAYKLPPFTETKLPNGLTVMLAEDGRLPLVTFRLVFLAGNKRDPAEIPGLASSVASMMLQGTTGSTYRQMAESLDEMGGVLSAVTASDSLTVDASVIAENAPKMLALIADISRNATFPENEVALHKQNRKQSLAAQYSQPSYLAAITFRKALFGDDPYGHTSATPASIDKVDRASLVAYRDTYLVPNNAILVIAGKLGSRLELMKTITAQFGSWQQKPVAPYVAPKPPDAKRQLLLVDRPGSVQADVRLGRVSATYGSADLFPQMMASIVEGGGPNSRLFLDIREKRGYAYDVHTEFAGLAQAGTFSVVTQVRNEAAADALQGILDHLDRMAREPVTRDELANAKAYANGTFLLGMEPQRGLADSLVQIKVMNLPGNYLETYTTRVNSVEPDQIQAVAKKYLQPDNDAIVVVGDAAKIQTSLEKIGKFEVVKP